MQFAFMKKGFYMDLPNCTLLTKEADRLVKLDRGFFRLRDRRWPWMRPATWQKLIDELDPVDKWYANSETLAAAQDMAFVFFDFWGFPRDWVFFYRRFAFHGRQDGAWANEAMVQ